MIQIFKSEFLFHRWCWYEDRAVFFPGCKWWSHNILHQSILHYWTTRVNNRNIRQVNLFMLNEPNKCENIWKKELTFLLGFFLCVYVVYYIFILFTAAKRGKNLEMKKQSKLKSYVLGIYQRIRSNWLNTIHFQKYTLYCYFSV